MSPDPDALLRLDPAVRYVAVLCDGALRSAQRAQLADASASESDRYEELLVNPTLLRLLSGVRELRWVAIRYGHFQQLVMRIPGGHVSVALAPDADPSAQARVLAWTLAGP